LFLGVKVLNEIVNLKCVTLACGMTTNPYSFRLVDSVEFYFENKESNEPNSTNAHVDYDRI
jgi:hypothetical protein